MLFSKAFSESDAAEKSVLPGHNGSLPQSKQEGAVGMPSISRVRKNSVKVKIHPALLESSYTQNRRSSLQNPDDVVRQEHRRSSIKANDASSQSLLDSQRRTSAVWNPEMNRRESRKSLQDSTAEVARRKSSIYQRSSVASIQHSTVGVGEVEANQNQHRPSLAMLRRQSATLGGIMSHEEQREQDDETIPDRRKSRVSFKGNVNDDFSRRVSNVSNRSSLRSNGSKRQSVASDGRRLSADTSQRRLSEMHGGKKSSIASDGRRHSQMVEGRRQSRVSIVESDSRRSSVHKDGAPHRQSTDRRKSKRSSSVFRRRQTTYSDFQSGLFTDGMEDTSELSRRERKVIRPIKVWVTWRFAPGLRKSATLVGIVAAVVHLLGLSRGDIVTIFRAFRRIDVDHVGTISIEEFINFLGAVESEFMKDLCKVMVLHLIDLNHTNMLEFDEFLLAVAVISTFTKEQLLFVLFRVFDIDSNGFIDRKEFEALSGAIHSMTNQSFPGNFSAFLESFGGNHDDCVDYREFAVLASKYPTIFYPAYKMQTTVRKKTLGESKWNSRLTTFAENEFKRHKSRRSIYSVLQRLANKSEVREIQYHRKLIEEEKSRF